MGTNELIKKLKEIMDKDKGASEYSQFVDQLSWLFFLKLYDEKEVWWEFEDSSYQSIIPPHLRWRNWAASKNEAGQLRKDLLTGDELLTFVNDDLIPTLKTLEVNPLTSARESLVKDFFQDATNFMKDGVLLRQIIDHLDQIDLNESNEKSQFIEEFESMLLELQASKKKEIIYSPRICTDFIIDRLQPQLGELFGDFACGTGGFLMSTLMFLRAQISSIDELDSLEKNILGIEKKSLPYRLSLLNLLLHELEAPAICYDNSLSYSVREFSPEECCDVIAMNPPFGGQEDSSIQHNFPVEMRTTETVDLFVALALYRLKPNGRAAIIVPDGFLFGTGGSTLAVKKKLIEEFNLHTIWRLPKGIFKIATNVLFFDKTGQTESIWFYEHQSGYIDKTYTAKQRPLKSQHLNPERQWWHRREENECAWQVSVEDVVSSNYNLDIKNPAHLPEPLLSSKEYIKQLEVSFADGFDHLNQIKKILS